MESGDVRNGRFVILFAIVAAVLGIFAWSQYSQRAEAEQTLGIDASRVLSEHFSRAAAVKVATLRGEVLAGGADEGFLGVVPSEQRTKMPYTVDYFVDLGRIGPGSYRWDQQSRTLTIDIPDVTAGRPNIDESQAVSRQEGLFISRRAALELARQTSERAAAASRKAAEKPEHIERARASARTVVASTAAGPLAAAGLEDVRIAVRFPWEPKSAGLPVEYWDGSRRMEDVLKERPATR